MPGWSVWPSIHARSALPVFCASNTPRSRNAGLLPLNQVCCHQWSLTGSCQLM